MRYNLSCRYLRIDSWPRSCNLRGLLLPQLHSNRPRRSSQRAHRHVPPDVDRRGAVRGAVRRLPCVKRRASQRTPPLASSSTPRYGRSRPSLPSLGGAWESSGLPVTVVAASSARGRARGKRKENPRNRAPMPRRARAVCFLFFASCSRFTRSGPHASVTLSRLSVRGPGDDCAVAKCKLRAAGSQVVRFSSCVTPMASRKARGLHS